MLGPLANNGGPTQTMALLSESPAIDAGSNALAVDPSTGLALATDQRGTPFNRSVGFAVDMGAFEAQNLNLIVASAEDRLDATFDRTNLTLRDAVAMIDANGSADSIRFAPTLDGTPIELTLGELAITDSVRITGNGAANTIIDAQQHSRIFDITNTAGDVTIESIALDNGMTTDNGYHSASNPGSGEGGAVRSAATGTLTVNDSILSGNSTTGDHAYGGAIYSNGTLSVTGTSFTGNSTAGDYAFGGAIFSDALLTVTNCNLTGNSTSGAQADGGAIKGFLPVFVANSTLSGNDTSGSAALGGAIESYAALTVTNSTLDGNSATGPQAYGGAIASGTLTVTNSTIAKNQAAVGGGIFTAQANETLTLRNTILAQNMDNGTAPDLAPGTGTTVTIQYSLIGDNTGTSLTAAPVGSPDVNGNLIGTAGALIDPMLGDLANNGGPTQTMALLAGSPAIDVGSSSVAVDPNNSPLTSDQRGAPFQRIVGASVDMGAFEWQHVSLIVTSGADQLDSIYDPAHATLRDAIAIANDNPGTDTITFAAALNGAPIDLSLGELAITDSVTITGNGSAKTIINAQHDSRIFNISSTAGNVTLDSLTLENGMTTAANDSGGAIHSDSTGAVAILNSSLTGNSTAGDLASGGAIYCNGELTVASTTLSGNSTTGLFGIGGAIKGNGAMTVTNSTLSGNSTAGLHAYGGAIASYGALNLTYSTLWGNSTTGNATTGTAASGGAIRCNGPLTVTNSTLYQNTTAGVNAYGGAIAAIGVTTVTNSTIVQNHATAGKAGGIYHDLVNGTAITLRNTILAQNTDTGTAPDSNMSPVTGPVTVQYSLIGDNTGTSLAPAPV
ncbi:MAG TPA: choice-of-anchor Q domain-containing protein, partial [Planctomycetaceae bacterium]